MIRRLAGWVVLLSFLLLVAAPVAAAGEAPGCYAAAGGSVEAVVSRANAAIDRAIALAQFLAEQTPLDDAAIADWLVQTTNRIVAKVIDRLGAGAVELYYIEVTVGTVTVLIDPMKVAGE